MALSDASALTDKKEKGLRAMARRLVESKWFSVFITFLYHC